MVAVLLTSCAGSKDAEPQPVRTYPSSFKVSDPELDEETTAGDLGRAPNADLVEIASRVGFDGLRTTFSYSKRWDPASPARWGIRFVVEGSDGTRLSGGWTQDPGSTELTQQVRLAPRPAGCAAEVQLTPVTRRLVLTLTSGCLPGVTAAEPRPWVRFDNLEAVSSWHQGEEIRYGWDQLFARMVAPEPARLYLPSPRTDQDALAHWVCAWATVECSDRGGSRRHSLGQERSGAGSG